MYYYIYYWLNVYHWCVIDNSYLRNIIHNYCMVYIEWCTIDASKILPISVTHWFPTNKRPKEWGSVWGNDAISNHRTVGLYFRSSKTTINYIHNLYTAGPFARGIYRWPFAYPHKDLRIRQACSCYEVPMKAKFRAEKYTELTITAVNVYSNTAIISYVVTWEDLV